MEEEAGKQENPELYKELLIDFFDGSSRHADDIDYASRVLALGFTVGDGGAIQAFLAKKGKKEAEKLFTKTVTSKLKAWGFTKLALMSNAAVQFALDYSDIGTQVAKYLDRRDPKPNNGWIDF